jgi:hypothetical protein
VYIQDFRPSWQDFQKARWGVSGIGTVSKTGQIPLRVWQKCHILGVRGGKTTIRAENRPDCLDSPWGGA